MAYGSQQGNVQLLSDIPEQVHDVFIGEVVDAVPRESPTADLFEDMGPGEYFFSGATMHGAVDLQTKIAGVATSGQIPDFQGMDTVEWDATPIRRYSRIAKDQFVSERATGPGSYEDNEVRLFRLLWNSWYNMTMRQSISAASGLVGKVSSRTDDHTFVMKDGYGNTDTNPCIHLAKGAIIAWWDMTATAAIDGAGVIENVDYSTNTVEMESAATWEPAHTLAADDLIYMASTSTITDAHFISERNICPNGVGTILDPMAASSTVFGIAEGTWENWKPYRVASTTFDHLEVQEHHQQLESKRGMDVTPQTDVCVAHGSLIAQLARTLMAYQQQANLGGELVGGWTGIKIGNMDIRKDNYFFHDVLATFYVDSIKRVPLGRDAGFEEQDGSMWNRIADWDGMEAHVKEYMNYVCVNRGANGALTGVTTDVTDKNWDPVPNY